MSFADKKKLLTGVPGAVTSSFKSKGKGKQSYENAKIKSTGGILDSFSRDDDGDQIMTGAVIVSGEVNNEKDADGTKNLWAELEKIGVEDDSVGDVYMYLLKNPFALKAFNGVPIDQRKNMLPTIVPDYQPKNRDVTIT